MCSLQHVINEYFLAIVESNFIKVLFSHQEWWAYVLFGGLHWLPGATCKSVAKLRYEAWRCPTNSNAEFFLRLFHLMQEAVTAGYTLPLLFHLPHEVSN
jgi:hypothetical protein